MIKSGLVQAEVEKPTSTTEYISPQFTRCTPSPLLESILIDSSGVAAGVARAEPKRAASNANLRDIIDSELKSWVKQSLPGRSCGI